MHIISSYLPKDQRGVLQALSTLLLHVRTNHHFFIHDISHRWYITIKEGKRMSVEDEIGLQTKRNDKCFHTKALLVNTQIERHLLRTYCVTCYAEGKSLQRRGVWNFKLHLQRTEACGTSPTPHPTHISSHFFTSFIASITNLLESDKYSTFPFWFPIWNSKIIMKSLKFFW